ncbi:unnamed protein product [Adineta ricciae]|uniref:Uncharacterized protein n=1 Tax=Adineta ricciae TaxID=249248 RepID=A0A813XWE4_ADIRI|nr:unnamed protein product [Adineta ricciae]
MTSSLLDKDVGSSASTATMTTISPNDLAADTSNDLYENREHFQAIFTNDSRFFDTSLHLFKSYYALGYIQPEEEKSDRLSVPSLTTSNGRRHRWKTRFLGSNHRQHDDHHNGTLKSFLTPILLRKNDHINQMHGEPGNPTRDINNSYKSNSFAVHYQPTSIPSISISDETKSDESEVTITRL